MIYRHPHPERFADLPQPDLRAHSGNLILWGAGKIGGMAAHCLRQRGIDVLAFCDTARDKIGTTYCGLPVIGPDRLRADYPGARVAIASTHFRSIERSLCDMGWDDEAVFSCASLFLSIDFDGYDFWMERAFAIRTVEEYMNALRFFGADAAYIDQLCIPITTRCTLRCLHCSAYIPYIARPADDDVDAILADLRRLWDAVGAIRCLYLLGGEPLLHPDIARLVRGMCADRRFDKLAIITNGTLLPDPELVCALRDDARCAVRLSDYGALSARGDALRALLARERIPCENVNYAYWNRLPAIAPRSTSPEALRDAFEACTAAAQFSLAGGRLFCCTPTAHLWPLGALPQGAGDSVDLRGRSDPRALSDDVARFLRSVREGRPLHACRYCAGNHTSQFEGKVPVAEQTRELLAFPRIDGDGRGSP